MDQRRPVLCTDIVLFTKITYPGTGYHILLIGRKNKPFAHSDGFLCLPGGHVNYGEDPNDCALRELYEETGLKTDLDQLMVFGSPDRDPREHTVSIVYTGFLNEKDAIKAAASSDACFITWVPIKKIIGNKIKLGFDHSAIAHYAIMQNVL
jgi:8-oxo-dGTP diphosphatase